MKITASEINNHVFEKSFRGYDIDEVTIFLSNLSLEWDRLLQENKMQKMQLDISEKETKKLKEIESTLLKTLRTAENTSSKIIDQANSEKAQLIRDSNERIEQLKIEAEQNARIIREEAQREADKIIADAQAKADNLLNEARNNSTAIKSEADKNIALETNKARENYIKLKEDYAALESQKKELVNQLKELYERSLKLVGPNPSMEIIEESTVIEQEIINSPEMVIEVEEEIIESKVNSFVETEEPISSSSRINFQESNDDLEIIEGIGPKIKEVLNENEIYSFKDIMTTPTYKIKEYLEKAGPHFTMHDPSTWGEQAKLAYNERWDELRELQDRLIAGKTASPEKKTMPEENTEEMIEKVNKVKAAIRKSMESQEEETNSESSFFDNFN